MDICVFCLFLEIFVSFVGLFPFVFCLFDIFGVPEVREHRVGIIGAPLQAVELIEDRPGCVGPV